MNIEPSCFFETYKDKILETAIFISKKQNIDIEDEFNKIKNDYLQRRGSFCEEIILNVEFDLHNYLESIRHSQIENVRCLEFFPNTNKVCKLINKTGTRFSSDIPIDELITDIKMFNCDFYIVHNHPFVYNACPSKSDLIAMDAIARMALELEKSGISNNFLDFSIVTDYDYWSMQQMINSL